ncbi:MAG TPA: FAD-binding oxidoreductase [Vicinamibacterales bacterium]|nr:FAD-binding oxidoreductase [Vicinamibacterales bacterium]
MANDTTFRDAGFTVGAQLIGPGDERYEADRHVWNGRIEKHPALIVRCATTGDVVAALRLAADQGLAVAVRGGGHGLTGAGTCDGGLVIDLGTINAVRVRPEERHAHVGGGATWRDVDSAAAAAGLATTGGMVSSVGVGGLTLGGGFGWLMRKHGLAVDNLVSAQVVTADAQVLNASPDEHQDLLWALKGGGGNFGVVTAFEFAMHPLTTVLGGLVLHPGDRTLDVLRFYRDFAMVAPDELTTMAFLMTAPPEPFVPDWLRGKPAVAILACYAGAPDRAKAVLEPLRRYGPPAADLLNTMPYTALQGLFDKMGTPGLRSSGRSCYLDGLTDRAIDVLADGTRHMTSPFSAVHLHHLQGAVGRRSPHETAFAHRDAAFALNILPIWSRPDEADAHVQWSEDLWYAMQPFAGAGVYVNFLDDEGPERVRAAYGENYDRLVAIKRKYDPQNVFHLNQNITP